MGMMKGFARLKVVDNTQDYTVGEFLRTRTREEFFRVNRFMQWMLQKRCGDDAPLWEREQAYDNIMEEPMNWDLWNDACEPYNNPFS